MLALNIKGFNQAIKALDNAQFPKTDVILGGRTLTEYSEEFLPAFEQKEFEEYLTTDVKDLWSYIEGLDVYEERGKREVELEKLFGRFSDSKPLKKKTRRLF